MLMQAAPIDDRPFYESRAERERRLHLTIQRLALAAQRHLNVFYCLLAEHPEVSLSEEELQRALDLQALIAGLSAGSAVEVGSNAGNGSRS